MKRFAAVLLALMIVLGVLPCKEIVWAASEEAALQPCEIVANADGTVTLYVVIDGNIRGFDFGVAFSLAEAAPVSYGFTDAFLESCGEQNGTAIDHYFEDGERVSGDDRYFVFGGMANSDAAYSGRMAYVTFALAGAQASVSVIKESAAYASAAEIRDKGTVYTLMPGTAAASQPGSGQNGAAPGAGSGQNGAAPGASADPDGSAQAAHGADGSSSGQGTDGAGDVRSSGNADQINGKFAADGGSVNAANGKSFAAGSSAANRTKTGDPAHTAGYILLILLSLLMEICCSFVLKHHPIDAIMKKDISLLSMKKKRRDKNASGND